MKIPRVAHIADVTPFGMPRFSFVETRYRITLTCGHTSVFPESAANFVLFGVVTSCDACSLRDV